MAMGVELNVGQPKKYLRCLNLQSVNLCYAIGGC